MDITVLLICSACPNANYAQRGDGAREGFRQNLISDRGSSAPYFATINRSSMNVKNTEELFWDADFRILPKPYN